MAGIARHAGAWLVWWAACFWLWFLLVGEWNRVELVAAACVATVAASFGERARTVAGLRFRVPARELTSIGSAVAMVPVDFAILVWVLVRSAAGRRAVRGRFVVHELDLGGDDPSSFGRRAWATYAATISPNAYVVDVDHEQGIVLLHDLVPLAKSEEPLSS